MTSLKKLNQDGFTLIEIIIVLPIVSMIVIGLSSFMISQFGQISAETKRSSLLLESEVLLFNIQDEILSATEFSEIIHSDLSDSYAPSGGWTFDTSPLHTLIISEPSLDADRRDPDREFVYKNQFGCASEDNPIAINNTIYFTTPNTIQNTLHRRTLVPQYSTCNTNHKVQTCPEANVGTGICQKKDSLLSEKVSQFTVEYYDEDNALIDTSTESPYEAEKIKISIEMADKAFGNDITVSTDVTMKKIN